MGHWLLCCATGLRTEIKYTASAVKDTGKTGLIPEPEKQWEKAEKSPLAHLIVANAETLLVVTSRGEFYAMHLTNAKRLTRYWRPFHDRPVMLAIDHTAGLLYFTGVREPEVFAYRLPESRVQWKRKYTGLRGQMVLRGDSLYVIQGKRHILILERQTGKKIDGKKLAAAPSAGLFSTGSGLGFLTESGALWIMDPELRRIKRVDLNLQPYPVWSVDQGCLLTGDSQGRLIVYSITENRLKFQQQYSTPIYSPPLMVGTQLLVALANGQVRAFDNQQYQLQWQYQAYGLLNCPLLVSKQAVLIPVNQGQLLCVDRQTGKLIWEKEFEHNLKKVVLTPAGLLVTDQKRKLFYLK